MVLNTPVSRIGSIRAGRPEGMEGLLITMSVHMSVRVSRRYVLNHSTFCNQTCMAVHYKPESPANKKGECYSKGHSEGEGLFNQSITVSTIASELIILLQPSLV